MMPRTVTIRIEVIVVLLILIVCIVLAEFPISISTICPRPPPAASNAAAASSPPAVTASNAAGSTPACECPAARTVDDAGTPAPARRRLFSPPPPAPGPAGNPAAPSPASSSSSSSSATSSAVASNVEAVAATEREQYALLGQPHPLRGSKKDGVSSLESRIEAELADLSQFVHDKAAQKALLDGAAAAARGGHRAYSAFTQALRNIATLARAAHVRDASRVDFTASAEPAAGAAATTVPVRIEMLRVHTSADDDAKLSVPSIPTNLPDLAFVAPTSFGLVAGFASPAPASAADAADAPTAVARRRKPGAPAVRTAVLLTGHMRSYRRCAERLRRTVLEPTDARMFLATYPDSGEKRYGVREQIRNDDAVDWHDVARSYRPHMAGLFVAEVPLLRRRLELAFPAAFANRQFSWMLYQFLLIEIGFNLTEAYTGGSASSAWDLSAERVGELSFGAWPAARRRQAAPFAGKKPATEFPLFAAANGAWPWAHLWRECGGDAAADGLCSIIPFTPSSSSSVGGGFDVFIRLRPDLFIVGTVRLVGFPRLSAATSTAAPAAREDSGTSAAVSRFDAFQLELECGGEAHTARNYGVETSVALFDPSVVLVSPHHPRNLWYLDKTSDLALVATHDTARRYVAMYADLSRLSAREQAAVFVPLCTAERLWNARARKLGLLQNQTFGWFFMLRNRTAFAMSNADGHKSPTKRAWIRSIFAESNSDNVPCPFTNGTMATVPPSPKKGGKRH